jgi:hypothetical protein
LSEQPRFFLKTLDAISDGVWTAAEIVDFASAVRGGRAGFAGNNGKMFGGHDVHLQDATWIGIWDPARQVQSVNVFAVPGKERQDYRGGRLWPPGDS